MRFRIRESSAASLCLAAVIARILYGMAIDMPEMYNSGWIAVLLGGVLALPAAFAAAKMRACSDRQAPMALLAGQAPALARVLAAVLALSAAVDAALAVDAIAGSAGYVALDNVAMIYLLLPQLALCAWGLALNGDAIGNSARICNRILACVFALFALCEAPDMCPAWLTPILGPGIPDLLDGALRAAGWLSLPVGLFLLAEPDEHPSGGMRPVAVVALGCAVGAALMLVHGMMLPPLVDAQAPSRYFLLDTVLTNGRTSLSLQLPKMIVWFISLFLRMLFGGFTCALALQAALPKLPRLACAALVVGAVGAMAISGFPSPQMAAALGRWLYAAQAGVALAAMAGLILTRKGGAAHA